MDISKLNFITANNNSSAGQIETVNSNDSSGEVKDNSLQTQEVKTYDKNDNPEQVKKGKITEKDLHDFVNKANKGLFTNSNHLEFSVHKTTNEIMVKVVDNDTKQVIREIPPESIVDMVAKLCEMAGILVDVKK